MKLRVLGPLEAEIAGAPVGLSAHKERGLLAALAVRANRPVSADELVDVLWGESPPRTAAKTLQTYVLHLRRTLGAGVIESAPTGYCLRVDDSALDVAEFERLTAEGRSALADGDAATASMRLRAALNLWRGPAYPDLADTPLGHGEAIRLEELRLTALEDANEADLALGQHRVLVALLERQVADHPLRERLWGQLMVALYRSGRQADALAAFQRARTTLADELGLDPGPELQRLEHAVLTQDPDLDVGTETFGPVGVAQMPTTRYARSAQVHLAYQVIGDGGPDLLLIPDWYSHLEALWEHPQPVSLLLGLARFARVIVFDPRGTGMSDPVDAADVPTVEHWVDDAVAVLDAAGSERAIVLGCSAGAIPAIMTAAVHPERVKALVLFNGLPSIRAPGVRAGEIGRERMVQLLQENWGERPGVDAVAPGLAEDPGLLAWFGRYQRLSCAPGRIGARFPTGDVGTIATRLPHPTLVVHRAGNQMISQEVGERLAASMANARFVPVPGDAHLWFIGDFSELLAATERFAAETHDLPEPATGLVTALSMELVGAVEPGRVERFGALLARHTERWRGSIVGSAGVRTRCTFTGPWRATACAEAAMDVARQLDLELRAGVHIGETRHGATVPTDPALAVADAIAASADAGEIALSALAAEVLGQSGFDLVERAPVTVDGRELPLLKLRR